MKLKFISNGRRTGFRVSLVTRRNRRTLWVRYPSYGRLERLP